MKAHAIQSRVVTDEAAVVGVLAVAPSIQMRMVADRERRRIERFIISDGHGAPMHRILTHDARQCAARGRVARLSDAGSLSTLIHINLLSQ